MTADHRQLELHYYVLQNHSIPLFLFST